MMNNSKKDFLTYKEISEEFKKMPPKKFLWSGIKEKSFGLVFGPSKSGKTIFCENLALNIAIGSKEYFGYKLSGTPAKILFIGLEEYWEDRVDRNTLQYETLGVSEKAHFESNFLYQPIEYLNLIVKDSDWEKLKGTIKKSSAQVVFIDSITRMNHGNIEDSRVAQEIMQKLRNICHKLQITLVCIHHTPKMNSKPITMDMIKGSAVFAQESDFAIGINYTANNTSYQKNVFFRYKSNPEETKVIEFKINSSTRLDALGRKEEYSLLEQQDRRRNDSNREIIIEFINNYQCKELTTNKLIDILKNLLNIKERQIKRILSDLVASNKIKSPKKGIYTSINCLNEGGDEEE